MEGNSFIVEDSLTGLDFATIRQSFNQKKIGDKLRVFVTGIETGDLY